MLAEIPVLLIIPLFEVLVDEQAAAVGTGISSYRGKVIRLTEDSFQGLEVFETHAIYDVGVMLALAGIVMCVAMKYVDTATAPTTRKVFAKRTACNKLAI